MFLKAEIENIPKCVTSFSEINDVFPITIVAGELFKHKSWDIWSYVLWRNVALVPKIGLHPFLAKPEIKAIACSSAIPTSI